MKNEFRIFSLSASNFSIFLRIFDEISSGFRDKFQKRVTCVAFSIKFAKTTSKIAEILEIIICENYSILFNFIQFYSILFNRVLSRVQRCPTASNWSPLVWIPSQTVNCVHVCKIIPVEEYGLDTEPS